MLAELDHGMEFFPTDREVVYALLESRVVALPGGIWIEPCAGTGRIISAVNDRRNDIEWIANEIDPRFKHFLDMLVRSGAIDRMMPYGDFVHRPWPFAKADVLIMNPPFSLTMQFVIEGMKRADYVVCLQRQGWFGTADRAPWFTKHCPDIYQLPWRPSFRPDGKTDNAEYCWYVWPPGSASGRRSGRVAMLERPTSTQPSLFEEQA